MDDSILEIVADGKKLTLRNMTAAIVPLFKHGFLADDLQALARLVHLVVNGISSSG